MVAIVVNNLPLVQNGAQIFDRICDRLREATVLPPHAPLPSRVC